MPYPAKLLMTEFVTHDVRRLVLSRPEDLDWMPGQGIELAMDREGWRDHWRPFSPTSLVEDRCIEFTIKRYDEDGVTDALHALEPGARLLLGEPFGTITYQGPGTFIAAGTGVTPFLAMLRRLAKDGTLPGHRLLLSNKTERDVICAPELIHYLAQDLVLTFTRESQPDRKGRRIDRAFLDEHLGDRAGFFYVCGPEPFVAAMQDHLDGLGIDAEQLVYEH
jgi:cytochrome-b5 reductase